MEWTDNLMLDAMPTLSLERSSTALEMTRVVSLEGVTLLYVDTASRDETSVALELLRGFRATGRRVVLCDTSDMVVGKQLGHEVVEHGGAQTLISCGISGREVGIGARDAGLNLDSVTVCGTPTAACKVLENQIAPGDTVLLMGLDNETFDGLVTQLESRLSTRQTLAA